MNKKIIYLSYFFIMFFLALFIFRSLAFNITKNLPDWNDYPYITWTIFQNADHIKSLQFHGFFDANAFYSFKGTLLFSDLLLPQSLIVILISYFTANPVLSFNILFFILLALNIVGSLYFWKSIFSDHKIIFFASLLTIFSPYFFLNSNHFQMISIWPYLFGIGFLLRKGLTIKSAVIVALLTTIEFLSSVYLSVFMLFTISIWVILTFYSRREELIHFDRLRKNIVISTIKGVGVFCLAFIILSGPFILKYMQAQKSYGISRDYGEYVLYSAHLTDYFFTTHYNSFISTLSPIVKWNSFNMHRLGEAGGFPGIVLLSLSLLGLFFYSRNSSSLNLKLLLSFNHVFFLILTASGLIFSLGPRLNANGTYLAIPLPYEILLKFNPLVEPIRATARWSFIFYFGLVYFACIGLKKINQRTKSNLGIGLLSILFLLEIVPINKISESKNYYPEVYKTIEGLCQSKGVLLEYP
ncbi:MAG: hypothetical protein Q7K55_08230, partial [Candidatus Levybacteria bacterium]|nr:hypothetical protein [Candidatus Levybacteria bacterium]